MNANDWLETVNSIYVNCICEVLYDIIYQFIQDRLVMDFFKTIVSEITAGKILPSVSRLLNRYNVLTSVKILQTNCESTIYSIVPILHNVVNSEGIRILSS